MFFAGLTLIIFLFPNFAFGTEVFKVKQAIGQDATYYWFHNWRYWSSEVLYRPGTKPWLMPGIGPSFATKIGPISLKAFGYLALMLDVSKSKTQWPVKTVEIDSFIVLTIKQYSFYIRSVAEVDPRRESSTWYWGRDFVGYQLSDSWQIRFQTEWQSRDEEWSRSLGFGWSQKLPSNCSFDGYFGCETERPYAKVGWLELKVSFK
ncbi:MAG: hypothetical protein AAB525_00530 [Patescibacteria group bacterium]